MKKVNYKRKIAFGFILSALTLAVLQIVISTSFTTAGINLSDLQYQKEAIEKENMILGEELYTKTSYTTITDVAEKEGFAQNGKARIVMSEPAAVALRQ